MLEKIDLSKKMKKPEYKEEIQTLSIRLGELQRACQSAKIPVMIVFEGLGCVWKRSADRQADPGIGPAGL